ncbi:protein NipSnap homolog 3A-like isoform X3 [Halichoerus grypus]
MSEETNKSTKGHVPFKRARRWAREGREQTGRCRHASRHQRRRSRRRVLPQPASARSSVAALFPADNFAHRTEVRKAVAKDKEWQQSVVPNLALIDEQETEITYLVPWSKLEKPAKEGVYELVIFQMKPGGPALWGDAFKRAINAHVDLGYSKLVGVFHTEYGALNRVHVLWWNESADSRAAGRHQSHEDPRVVAAVRESVNYLVSQQNTLLIPTSFSPLK